MGCMVGWGRFFDFYATGVLHRIAFACRVGWFIVGRTGWGKDMILRFTVVLFFLYITHPGHSAIDLIERASKRHGCLGWRV